MSSLAWEAVQSEFLFDGGLRDIYVLGTDMAGWQRMLDGLRSADYDLRYFRDNNPTELPARAEDEFTNEREYCSLLSVQFGGILANCHFFCFEEIEFDIDPQEVSGQAQLDALLEFMQCLAAAVGQDAILCPENLPKNVIIRVTPEGYFEHRAVSW
jgi:hypothetical protein